MLQYFTSRTFGVEIETFGLKYTISPADQEVIPPYKIMNRSQEGMLLAQVFQGQGISLNGYAPGEEPYGAWSFVLDDTVKGAGGNELVSPILSGLPGLSQVYEVLLLMQEFPELQVNETCGFHVHHGVDPLRFGGRELRRLVKIVSLFEDYIFRLLPRTRKGFDTCRPLEIDLYEWFRGDGGEEYDACVKNLWYSPENRHDPQTSPQRKYHPTRYHGLNLHSYWYRGTIEFRYFPSLLDEPEEMMQWIIFSQFLVELSEGQQPVLEWVRQPNKWLNTLYKIYLGLGLRDRLKFPRGQARMEQI